MGVKAALIIELPSSHQRRSGYRAHHPRVRWGSPGARQCGIACAAAPLRSPVARRRPVKVRIDCRDSSTRGAASPSSRGADGHTIELGQVRGDQGLPWRSPAPRSAYRRRRSACRIAPPGAHHAGGVRVGIVGRHDIELPEPGAPCWPSGVLALSSRRGAIAERRLCGSLQDDALWGPSARRACDLCLRYSNDSSSP